MKKGRKSNTEKLKNQVSTLQDENTDMAATIESLQLLLQDALNQAVDIAYAAKVATDNATAEIDKANKARDTALFQRRSFEGQLGVLPMSEQERQRELQSIGFTLNELSVLSKHISGGDTDVALGLLIHPNWKRGNHSIRGEKHRPDIDEQVILVDAIRSQYIETKFGNVDAEALRHVGFSIVRDSTGRKRFDELQSNDLSTTVIDVDSLGMGNTFVGSDYSRGDQPPATMFMPHNKEAIANILKKLKSPKSLYSSEEIFTMAQMIQHHSIARQLAATNHNELNSDGHKERFNTKYGEPEQV